MITWPSGLVRSVNFYPPRDLASFQRFTANSYKEKAFTIGRFHAGFTSEYSSYTNSHLLRLWKRVELSTSHTGNLNFHFLKTQSRTFGFIMGSYITLDERKCFTITILDSYLLLYAKLNCVCICWKTNVSVAIFFIGSGISYTPFTKISWETQKNLPNWYRLEP